jgi:hypothetical protein
MPRNKASIEQAGDIHCYDCGHDYDYLGSGPHPGCCEACGSDAVSLSGEVEVADVFTRDHAGGKLTSIDVVVLDETKRSITFSASSCDGFVVAEIASIGSARIKAGTEPWDSDIVPEEVVEALEARGETFIPSVDRPGPGNGPIGDEGGV